MKTRWPVYLSSSEIEKEFLLAAIHLKQIVVLDGIERVGEPPGFRIRSHDLHGPLPEVVVRDTGCRFLPHKVLDHGVVVGLQAEGRTLLAEAPTFWQAYGKLRRRGLRR